MARLKHHQVTFDLLGLAPLASEPNRRLLECTGEAVGLKLPAAAVEWLSLENGIPLLRRPGRADEAIPLRTLVARIQSLAGVRKPRLIFLRESQSGCCWAFDLAEETDPPVYVRLLDKDGRESWRTTAERFSDFVFGWVWDNPRDGLGARAQLNCTLKQIRRLAGGAIERPTSRAWPTHKTFRFQLANARLRLHYEPEGWTDVVLWAAEPKAFAALVDHAAAAGLPRRAFFSEQPAVNHILLR